MGGDPGLHQGLGMNLASQYVPPPEVARGIMIAIAVAAVLIVLNIKATRSWFQTQIHKVIHRVGKF